MNAYLVLILAIMIGGYALDLVVDTLNLRHLKTDLPEEFEGYYPPEKYRQSQLYTKENTRFGIVRDSILTPLTIAFLMLGGFNAVDRIASGFGLGMIPTGLIFAGILLAASQLISLPFSIYDTFVIEEKYGFNRTTWGTFIKDILKSWVLGVLIGGLVLAVVLWIFQKAGPWAWFYCWMAVTLFQVFLMFIAPVVIMPLFNKFEPLADGELKDGIEAYAQSMHFKMKGLFTMDGSRRSTKANAFFTGFGRFRRIVLFDTLISKHTVEELVSILAHEMGHYKKWHIYKTLGMAVATTGLMFFILSLFINNAGLFEA
ncbi:MAG: M48 family metallopeptidase, partial [Deltaproteobacteria bacterium]|nr:M48 family metallopeptidase [Deltaproteobacteria bacterium]